LFFQKNGTLIASGTGQTSRVDALQQAIETKNFHFDLGCCNGKRCIFPFPDCVELAKEAGITAVIQPGVHNELSIYYKRK
jgi:phosphoribosylaminoimidazolecarboxamide formyltransferase/IMP cyclohydrolase